MPGEPGREPVQGRAVNTGGEDLDIGGPGHIRREVRVDHEPVAPAGGDLIGADAAGVGPLENVARNDMPEGRYLGDHAGVGVLQHRPGQGAQADIAKPEPEPVYPPVQPHLVGGVDAGQELVGLVWLRGGERRGAGYGQCWHRNPPLGSLSVCRRAERLAGSVLTRLNFLARGCNMPIWGA